MAKTALLEPACTNWPGPTRRWMTVPEIGAVSSAGGAKARSLRCISMAWIWASPKPRACSLPRAAISAPVAVA